MAVTIFSTKLTRWGPLAILLLIAAVWLYRTPYSASNLEVPPDTVEYALAPLQLLETGRYEIIVEGRGLPPRYPPWFPVMVVLPAYVLFGHEPGNAILPVTVLAVAGIGFAYAIGKRLSSTTGGVLAALFLLALPPYSNWAAQPMTDIPCTTLMLGTCLIYLHLRSRPKSVLLYSGAGILVAVTALFRPVFAAMLVPFLLALPRVRKGAFLRGLVFLLPIVAAAAATFAYNYAAFGSALRNGYKFWVAVPMDYPTMTFSPSYFRENFDTLIFGIFPILLLVGVGCWFLARWSQPVAYTGSRQLLQDVAIFFACTTLPILAFHLFYFFSAIRFYIPVLAGTAILTGVMFSYVIDRVRETVLRTVLPVMLLLSIAGRLATPAPVPLRRVAADNVRKYTPENAIVISAIDPVYLARLGAYGSSRRIVPLSRNVEYASKLLVRKKVEDRRLRLLNWEDPRALSLIRPHAEEAVQFVASERISELINESKHGTPVFFDSTFAFELETPAVASLQAHFNFIRRGSNLYELQLP